MVTTPSLAARLRRLADLLPAIEAEGFVAATVRIEDGMVPYTIYAPEIDELHRRVYDDGWILWGFDWMTWGRTEEGRRLAEDGQAMVSATPEQLARVLTALVRSERFAEGTLAGAAESGLIQRVLQRAAVLATEP